MIPLKERSKCTKEDFLVLIVFIKRWVLKSFLWPNPLWDMSNTARLVLVTRASAISLIPTVPILFHLKYSSEMYWCYAKNVFICSIEHSVRRL